MTNQNEVSRGGVRATAGLNCLLGIWLFVSPWVYGAYTSHNSWNSWIVGAAIAIIAAIRFANRGGLRFFSWLNLLLGAWTFASPWICSYTGNDGRFINSLCVGVIVFVLAAYGMTVGTHTTHSMPPRSA